MMYTARITASILTFTAPQIAMAVLANGGNHLEESFIPGKDLGASGKRLSQSAASLFAPISTTPLHVHLQRLQEHLPKCVATLAHAVGWNADFFADPKQRNAFVSGRPLWRSSGCLAGPQLGGPAAQGRPSACGEDGEEAAPLLAGHAGLCAESSSARLLRELVQDCSATDTISLDLQNSLSSFLGKYYPATSPPIDHMGTMTRGASDYSVDVESLVEQLRRHSSILLTAASALSRAFLEHTGDALDALKQPLSVYFWILRFATERSISVREKLAAMSTPPANPAGVPGSNNPTTRGANYSFNKGGVAAREGVHVKMLDKSVSKTSAKKFGFDDDPLDPCLKGSDPLGSDSYCMFLFCPLHCHIWGTVLFSFHRTSCVC